jgi:hypothetical protein
MSISHKRGAARSSANLRNIAPLKQAGTGGKPSVLTRALRKPLVSFDGSITPCSLKICPLVV